MATVEQEPAYRSKDWLHEKYWGEGKSIPTVANEAGVSESTVLRWMGRLGVETRSRSETAGRPVAKTVDGERPTNVKYPRLHDEEWLRWKYVDEGLSCRKIGDIVGSTDCQVLKALRKFDIPRRPPTGEAGGQ